MEIDTILINKCLTELRMNQTKKKVFKDFYENNVDMIMADYSMQEAQSNRKIPMNYAKKFVQQEVGYSLGNPVTYISKSNNANLINKVDYYYGTWSKAEDQKLRKESEIYGKAFEVAYIDQNGEFNAMVLNPLNGYALEDENYNVILGLHTFFKKFDDTEYMDVYIGNKIYHYTTTLQYIGEDTHIFNRVPFIVCRANDEEQSGFNDIVPLMKGYNDICSDEINLINDFRNAYLIVTGNELTTDTIAEMKTKGIINISADGKVEWLQKDIQDAFINNALTNLENKIYDIMNETNLNKDFTSNTSGNVLRLKLTNLENKLSIVEASFEKVLRERLRFLSDYLLVKTGQGFDVKDLKIQFTRNLPTDIASLADSISKLSPIVSQKTLLALMPFINNVDSEIEQFKKEKTDALLSLDNVQ